MLLLVGLITAWSLTTENKIKAKAKPDKQITLFYEWIVDSYSIKLEGTYIYGAETFCFKLTSTDKTRQVSSVSLSSIHNDAISVILVEHPISQNSKQSANNVDKTKYRNIYSISKTRL